MKVLQVIDRLNIGGAERVFLDIIELLVQKNIETGALLFNTGFPWDNEIDNRAQLNVLGRQNKFSLSKLYKTNKICSAYDVVHVHMRHCYAYVRLAQILFRGKYTIIFHDHYGDIEINKAVPWHLKSILKPKYYIGVSKALVQWAQKILSVSAENVFYLSNTIIPNNSVHFEYNSDRNKAFMVSNIRETKNIEFGIDLCRHIGIDLDIYGNKTSEEYYKRMKDAINGDARIRIIEGEKDIYNHCNNYSFAIHCAKSETGPLVLLEYMTYGIPFVSYQTGDIANTIAAELPEYFVQSFDKEEWVKKMEDIKSCNSSGKLKHTFNKYFSAEKYINECLGIYQKVLS
jgi:glycosyltransferase involved in cell wall biosynthesis